MIRKLFPVYTASIFFTLHFATTLYINSSYLGGFFSPATVSLLYIIGSVVSIFLFLHAPDLLERFGYRRFLVIVAMLLFIATAGLVTAPSPFIIALSFILYGSVYLLAYFILDVYIEEVISNARTGSIRGLYLTLVNMAIAVAPLMVAIVSSGRNLASVYAFSLLFLVPVILLGVFALDGRVPHKRASHHLPFSTWRRAINVRRVTIARFVLELFFAVMVIYTPLYLSTVLGFSWKEIGVMFFIMLLPFVVLEWPAGILADKLFGEKEMMGLGFFLAGIALLVMPFLDKNFIAWTSALFLSRVGASLIEITTESYFFKHVDSRDAGIISIFRISRPLATVTGALLGAFISCFLPFQTIFLVLAVIVFLGLRQSALLKDTL